MTELETKLAKALRGLLADRIYAFDFKEAEKVLAEYDAAKAQPVQDEREAFEAWWKGDVKDWRGHDSVPALHAWAGWQARAAIAATPAPVTLADVLDALNLFNRPKPSEDDGPWEAGHFIRVDYLPAFINIIAAAWFARPKAQQVATPAPAPLTREQIDIICERERMKWSARKGPPTYEFACAFARAIERAHGIGQGKDASNA